MYFGCAQTWVSRPSGGRRRERPWARRGRRRRHAVHPRGAEAPCGDHARTRSALSTERLARLGRATRARPQRFLTAQPVASAVCEYWSRRWSIYWGNSLQLCRQPPRPPRSRRPVSVRSGGAGNTLRGVSRQSGGGSLNFACPQECPAHASEASAARIQPVLRSGAVDRTSARPQTMLETHPTPSVDCGTAALLLYSRPPSHAPPGASDAEACEPLVRHGVAPGASSAVDAA